MAERPMDVLKAVPAPNSRLHRGEAGLQERAQHCRQCGTNNAAPAAGYLKRPESSWGISPDGLGDPHQEIQGATKELVPGRRGGPDSSARVLGLGGKRCHERAPRLVDLVWKTVRARGAGARTQDRGSGGTPRGSRSGWRRADAPSEVGVGNILSGRWEWGSRVPDRRPAPPEFT
eukprot:10453716-Alexandrium_andersonii.AAC.1